MHRIIMPDDFKMVLKVSLVIVVGILSAANGRTTPLQNAFLFGFESDRYIKPENGGKSWKDAQQMCRKYNSTLAIVDSQDRQRSFEAALYNFRLNGTGDVWLGATASYYGSGNWRWLDGDKYSGNVKQVQGTDEYRKSYAFLSKHATIVSAYASEPSELYSYICQYNTTTTDVCLNGTGQIALISGSRCFVQYNDTLSWFNARNNCLDKNGDLASFSDMSLLHEIVDLAGSWVGLRHSQWNWQNAVFNEIYTIPIEEPPDERSTTAGVRNDVPGSTGSGYKVNVPLAIGLAVGLGGAAIIAIIVIIIVVVVRKKHRNRKAEEQNRRDQSVSLPQSSLTPPTYMQLNLADKLEKNVYAKIENSPPYIQPEESTNASGSVNLSELSPYATHIHICLSLNVNDFCANSRDTGCHIAF